MDFFAEGQRRLSPLRQIFFQTSQRSKLFTIFLRTIDLLCHFIIGESERVNVLLKIKA